MKKDNYKLIDSGNFRKLESFDGILVNRSAPQARWNKNIKCKEWNEVDIYFNNQSDEWQNKLEIPEDWNFIFNDIKTSLRLSSKGQVGVFPEQMENWRWVSDILSEFNEHTKVLNAFAYTGVSTLISSAASNDVEVWHVDAGKSFVNWAKENAKLSGLDSNKIHWIVEDALNFFERETKRAHRYDGLIIDPPAFGRSKNKVWKLSRDLPKLVELCGRLLSDKPLFICFSWHDPELSERTVVDLFKKLPQLKSVKFEIIDLVVKATNGHDLPAGKSLRFG